MPFGPLSEYGILPPSLIATIVLVIVAVGIYLAWRPRPIRGHELTTVGVLLATNTAVFFVQWVPGLFDPQIIFTVVNQNGLLPEDFVMGRQWWAIVTSMFVHGGFAHFVINMLVLWFIGSMLERRLGRRVFLALYLATGLAAGVVTILGAYLIPAAVHAVVPALPERSIPNVGASGAIFGLLGYLVVRYPHEKFLLIFPPVVLKAWVLAVGFVAFNLLLAFIPGSRIAWWAHLGGMAVGALWAHIDKKRGKGKVRIDGVTGWGSGGPVRYTYTYRPR